MTILFGANSVCALQDATDLDLLVSTGWTIALRGKITKGASQKILLSIDDGAFNRNYLELRMQSNGVLSGKVVSDNTTLRQWDGATPTPTPDADNIVYAIMCDNTGVPYLAWCAPGGAVYKTAASSGLNSILGDVWALGADRAQGPGYLNGDELESWGIATHMLSDAQLQAYANGTALPAISGVTIQRYYPCDEGSGSVINEANNPEDPAYNGTLSGTFAWEGGGGGGDTVKPVITLLGDNPLQLIVGDTYTDPGATATDDTDGDITANIVVAGDTVNTAEPGTYVVTYNVSDAAANAADQVTRTVVVSPVGGTITTVGNAALAAANNATTLHASIDIRLLFIDLNGPSIVLDTTVTTDANAQWAVSNSENLSPGTEYLVVPVTADGNPVISESRRMTAA